MDKLEIKKTWMIEQKIFGNELILIFDEALNYRGKLLYRIQLLMENRQE